MFKVLLVLVTIGFVMSGNANATLPNDKWVSEGVRMSQPVNSANIVTTTVSQGNFDSLALCNQFISDQQSLNLGTFRGYQIFSTVVAKCSQSQ